MAEIVLDGVGKVFPGGIRALSDLSLTVRSGEWLTLVGPSGCGKTTTLRLIAGLETPTSGTIRIGGKVVTDVAPWRRDLVMLFQRPALFPNMTVRDNLVFGLRLRRSWLSWNNGEENAAAERAAGWLNIKDLLDRAAWELSSGQQQRVALGRTLVRKAAVALLDEPFGHLDAPLRRQFQRELPLLRERFPPTMVIVTHDPAEAIALGDRMAVLHEGQVQQVDKPRTCIEAPANRFVADFLRDWAVSS